MSASEARAAFVKAGRLTQCPNPPHDFTVGRLMGSWRWGADNCWSSLSDDGHLTNYGLHLGTVETPDGLKAFRFMLGRFSFIAAWL